MVDRSRRALVAGGTGLVGRELLTLLASHPRYLDVVSLTRRAAPAPAGVRTQIISFDTLDAIGATVDDAFCCLGTTRRAARSDAAFRRVDYDYVLGFGRAAKRAGATRFVVVSSIGADPASRWLYPRVKGQMEQAVAALGFPVLAILRPSFLLGQRAEIRTGEAAGITVTRWLTPLLVGPLRRVRPVDARTVAEAMIALALGAPDGVTLISSDAIAGWAARGRG